MKIRVKNVKNIFKYIVIEALVLVILTPIMVFHGPFKNIKNFVVDRSVNSTSHKYIAEFFLSKKELEDFKALRANKVFDEQDMLKGEEFKNTDNTIEVEQVNTNKNFKGTMVIVHDPKRVKVGYAKDIGKVGEKVTSIAKRNNAIAAINGGGFFFGATQQTRIRSSMGGEPMGFIISDSKVIYDDKCDTKKEVVAFTEDDVLVVGKYTLEEVKKLKVKEAICFGPPLVINGKPQGNEEIGVTRTTRTAIGQRKDGTVLMFVTDGDFKDYVFTGASFKDLEDIMIKYGAETAANLDGGGSSTLYLNGELSMCQVLPLGERTVPSIFYVK